MCCSFNCDWSVSQAEKEVMQEAVLKAVDEERRNMEKIHAEERKLWEAERASHKEKIAQAVSEAMQEQRKQNQVSMFYPSMQLLCVFLVLLLNVFCCCGRFSCDICHSVDICNAQQAVYLHLDCVYGERLAHTEQNSCGLYRYMYWNDINHAWFCPLTSEGAQDKQLKEWCLCCKQFRWLPYLWETKDVTFVPSRTGIK